MSQYCVAADVTTYAIPATSIPANITPTMIDNACVAASAEADAYLRARYPLPINGSKAGGSGNYDPALVRHTAYIAGYILMSMRGFMASGGQADGFIYKNYVKAVGDPQVPGSKADSFFGGVERGSVHLDVLVNQPTPPTYQLPQVRSKPPRGI